MAYRAEIEIAVRGANDLQELRNRIESTGEAVDRINSRLVNFSRTTVSSFDELSGALLDAKRNFDAAARGTNAYGDALDDLLRAERSYNNELRERNRLLDQARAAQEAAQRAVSPSETGFTASQYGPAAPPSLIRSGEIQQSWTKFFFAAEEVAQDLNAIATAREGQVKQSWSRTFARAEAIAEDLKDLSAAREGQIKQSWTKFFYQAEDVAEDLKNAATAREGQVKQSWTKFFFAAEEVAQDLNAIATARENKIKMSWNTFLAKAEEVAQDLNAISTAKAGNIKLSWNRFFAKAEEVAQDLNARSTAREGQVKQSWTKFFFAAEDVAQDLNALSTARKGKIKQSWTKFFAQAEEVAQDLQKLSRTSRTSGGPKARTAAQAVEDGQKRFGAAVVGGGFPLLFGGGPGAVLGGVLGGALGGRKFGFEASLGLSTLGTVLDRLVGSLRNVGDAFKEPEAALSALTEIGFKVSASTERQIKSLTEAGKRTEAYNLLLQETGVRPEQVNALRDLDTAFDQLQNELATLFVTVGSELTPALVVILKLVQDFVDSITGNQIQRAAANLDPEAFQRADRAAADASSRFGIMGDYEGYQRRLTQASRDIISRSSPNLSGIDSADPEKQQAINDVIKNRAKLLEMERDILGDTSSLLDERNYKERENLIYRERDIKLDNLSLENKLNEASEAKVLLDTDKALLQLAQQRAAEEYKVLKARMRTLTETANARTLGLDRELTLLETAASIDKVRLGVALDKAIAAKDYAKVYDIQIQLASIDFDLATKRIEAEVKKLQIAYELLQAQKAIVQAAILENEANGRVVGKLKEELSLLDVKVEQAKASLEFGEKLAKEQLKQAEAVKQAAEESARMQLEQSIAAEASSRLAESQAAAASASAQQANSSAATASNAEQTANALQRQTQQLEKQAAIKTRTFTATFQLTKQLMDLERGDRTFANPAEQIEFFRDAEKPFIELKEKSEALSQAQDLQAQATQAASLGMDRLAQKLERYAEQVARSGKVLSQFRESKSEQFEGATSGSDELTPFAEGGYVDRPTKALIGEAGPEYVIREDQMKEALVRYASGRRGEEVTASGSTSPNISIKTGPVMQVGGQDYISRADFERGMKEMSASLLTTIRRSPSTRSRLGI